MELAGPLAPGNHGRVQSRFPDGYKDFVCVYPIYLNKERTLAEGRRVRKAIAVKNPVFTELMDVMMTTGLQVVGEPNKIHPREKSREPPFWGRIRVQIKAIDGEIINENFECRNDVYEFLATKIPQLKSRTQPKAITDEKRKGGKGKRK